MARHHVRKGLDIPIEGVPAQEISPAPPVRQVAVLAADFVGMKPKILVEGGDTVKRGDPLFEDRKTPGVLHVAPGAGRVMGVHRGEKRAFLSIVIELADGEAQDPSLHRRFEAYRDGAADQDRDRARALLVESGLWTALRTRPFSRVPTVDSIPKSIFVTATDTNPLAADPEVTLADRPEDLERGLRVLALLTDGPVRLCRAPGAKIEPGNSGAQVEEFGGRHPAGTAGFHIHTLDPVYRGKEVWHLSYADTVRIGKSFATGTLDVERTIALAGPPVKSPRLLKTRVGASVDALVSGELAHGGCRTISGSVLSGRTASGPITGYLGAYHLQLSVLEEANDRQFLGWLTPGAHKFSVMPVFLSKLLGKKTFRFTTTTNGSRRAMVPIGAYERVMPMDLMPTHLLRALSIGDLEWAEELGVLELDEEDLALCTFVDPGKTDFVNNLRSVLNRIHEEG